MKRLISLFSLLLAAGCSGDAEPDRPSVVLVICDTWRSDAVSSAGGAEGLTPYVDRLSAEGVRFTELRGHAPWTLPSIASILTSLHPIEHGAGGQVGKFRRMADGVTTLAHAFADGGYRTHAVVNVDFLDPEKFGVTRGFETVDVQSYDNNREVRAARATTEAALRWIEEEAGDEPFFLLVHYFDPHCVYAPPGAFRERWAAPEDRESDWTFGTREQMIAIRTGRLTPGADTIRRAKRLYDGEVAYFDAEFGRLTDRLRASRRSSDTVIALTADHGEEFLEHGGFEHGHTLFEELVHLPLVIHAPGRLVPGVVEAPARHIDLAPTLLELCDLPAPGQFVGRSLLPLTRGEGGPPRGTLAHGNFWRSPLTSWVSDGWKLIELDGAPPLLFDLRRDPGEQRNLAGEAVEQLARLRGELRAVEAGMAALGSGSAASLDEATRRRLEALGYGGPTEQDAAPDSR